MLNVFWGVRLKFCDDADDAYDADDDGANDIIIVRIFSSKNRRAKNVKVLHTVHKGIRMQWTKC